MKAVCIFNHGNDFDPEVGEIVALDDLYITRIWRNSEELTTSLLHDEEKPGYFKSADVILSLLKEGDEIEDNYCHGRYVVV